MGAGGLPLSRSRSCSAQQQQKCLPCATAEQQQADLSLLRPLLQSQWHCVKNAQLSNTVIKPFSSQKVWWSCDKCPEGHPHVWQARVSLRSQGTNCPYCTSRAVCPHNCLASQAPAIAAQWSDKNSSTPFDYTVSSNQLANWECTQGHEWIADIKQRTRTKSGCPQCEDKTQQGRLRQHHPVLTQSQHPMMQFWDWKTNAAAGLDAGSISCRSNKRTYWTCAKCPKGAPHRWHARVKDMFTGSGCPCCTGHQICKCNSLQSLHPELAAEWDYNRNQGTPADYSAGSGKKVWWCNNQRGSFLGDINSRTRRPRFSSAG